MVVRVEYSDVPRERLQTFGRRVYSRALLVVVHTHSRGIGHVSDDVNAVRIDEFEDSLLNQPMMSHVVDESCMSAWQ